MADAMAAYYLTHKRGATMNRKRVEQFLQIYYQLGDCKLIAPDAPCRGAAVAVRRPRRLDPSHA